MAFSRWLVRRAGLARVSLGAALLGLAGSALAEPLTRHLLLALALVLAALAMLALATIRSPPRAGPTSPAARTAAVRRGPAEWPSMVRRMDLAGEVRRQSPGLSAFGGPGAWVPVLVVLAFCLAGASLGALRAAELRAGPAFESGPPVSVRVTIVSLTSRDDQAFARLDDGPFRGRTVLLVLPDRGSGPAGHVVQEPLQPTEGLQLLVRGRYRPPRAEVASGFDQRAYLLRKGAAALLQVRTLSVLGRRGGLEGYIDDLREAAREHLSAGLDARYSGLLRGVILGEQAELAEDDKQAFRASGTAHILSVSGLHVASLASIVLIGGAAAKLPRAAVSVMAGLLAMLFVPLTGASPPVLRATLVFLLFLLAETSGRGRDRYQVLLLAALAVLARNPYSIGDPGFQLSFAAAASMLLLTRRFETLLEFLPGALRQGTAVSLAATLGTAPISLFTFDQVSLSGIAANLLVVPLLAPLMALGLASVAAGFVAHPAAQVLNQVSAILLAWLCLVARVFAHFPLLRQAHLWPALAAAAGVAVGLPLSSALLQRPPPFRLRSRLLRRLYARLHRQRGIKRRWRLVLALLLPVLFGLLGLGAEKSAASLVEQAQAWAGGHDWPSSVELRILDVGQGSAALLRTPSGRSVLFDAGPLGSDLGGQLRSLGVETLDLAVLSHPHADHFGGLREALNLVRVRRVVDPVVLPVEASAAAPDARGLGPELNSGLGSSDGRAGGEVSPEEREAAAYRELRRELADQGASWTQAADGLTIHMDEVEIQLRAPSHPLTLSSGDELNDAGVVALLRTEGAVILLPGDAEAEVLARYRFPPVTVLVVPHHGSQGSVTRTLLNRLSPELAVVSVGRDNSFGHPHGEVLDMLQQADVPVIRTDEQGWVALRVGSWGLAAEARVGLKDRHAQGAAGAGGK